MNTLERLQDGKKHQVSQAEYETFLELLPPVCFDLRYQGERWDFGFAEGADPIRLFKKQGANFYAIETPYLNPFEVGAIDQQKRRWIVGWVELGRNARVLGQARELLLTTQSFQECETDAELLEKLRQPYWQLGQAFFIGNLCFVNLANQRGEWLVMKEGTVLERLSFYDLPAGAALADAHKVIDDLRAFQIFQCGKREGQSRR